MRRLGIAEPDNVAEPTSHVHAEVIEGIAPDELEKVLTGRKLLHARRKGKQMWMELDGEAPALMFHFGTFCPLKAPCMLAVLVSGHPLQSHDTVSFTIMTPRCAGMTGFCAIQGVPIIEYVNAKSRTDEWPPKYWKVAAVDLLTSSIGRLDSMTVPRQHAKECDIGFCVFL